MRLAIIILLALPLAVHAADYTVSTTGAQEAALTDIIATINEERAARVPPAAAITKAQYMQALVTDHGREWVRQRAREVLESVTTWASMTAGQKTKFCNAINLSPCPQ